MASGLIYYVYHLESVAAVYSTHHVHDFEVLAVDVERHFDDARGAHSSVDDILQYAQARGRNTRTLQTMPAYTVQRTSQASK